MKPLTPKQQAMLDLLAKGPLSVTRLAQATGQTPQGAVRTAASLVRRNVVRREKYAGHVMYRIRP